MTNIRPSTRDAIIEAAFHLYKEYPTASLADIAKHAGIGRATLHRHFKGREELLLELAEIAIRELDDVAESAAADADSCTQALQLIMQALIPLADRQWFLSREAVENSPQFIKEYQRQSNEMLDLIAKAKKEGSFNKAMPNTWIAQAFDSLLYAAWETVLREEATAGQAAELAWSTLLKGTGSQNG